MNHEAVFLPLSRQRLEDLREMVRDKLLSRDWWLFLPGLEGMQTVKEIELSFYSGSNCPISFFEEHVTPFNKLGVYGFAFGYKKRLTARRLASFLRQQPLGPTRDSRPFTYIDLLQHDVIVLATPAEAAVLIKNFYNWLGERYAGD